MSHPAALVLTTNPTECLLNEAVAERVRVLVPGPDNRERWLAPGAAYEFVWHPADARAIRAVRAAVTAALASHPIDVNVVPGDPETRAKKLLVADMESTIIVQELIDELAELAGRRTEIAALTRATMRGEIDFVTSLRHRIAQLKGLTTRDLEIVAARVTPMPGAARLVAGMTAAGARTALVSGGFTVFTERVARRLGFDIHYGNVLMIENGRLTGQIFEPIIDAAGKRAFLLDLAAEADIDLSQTLAVGDGANDLLMLEAAGLGVAFRAKPAVRAAMAASPTGAVIDHADLTALLALQGLAAQCSGSNA